MGHSTFGMEDVVVQCVRHGPDIVSEPCEFPDDCTAD